MLCITGLDVLGEYTVEADGVNIDYPNTLALYLIGTSIGVKKSRESRNFGVAKERRERAVRFTNSKTRRIARLVRILGNNYLEEIFISQVTMSMLRPLRCRLLRLARLNTPSGKDRRALNKGRLKYGIRVPRNAKNSIQFDQDNGNKLWANVILKELEALMSMIVFRKLPSSLC